MKKKSFSIAYIPLSDLQVDQVDRGYSVYMQKSRYVKQLGQRITFIQPVFDLRRLSRGQRV